MQHLCSLYTAPSAAPALSLLEMSPDMENVPHKKGANENRYGLLAWPQQACHWGLPCVSPSPSPSTDSHLAGEEEVGAAAASACGASQRQSPAAASLSPKYDIPGSDQA